MTECPPVAYARTQPTRRVREDPAVVCRAARHLITALLTKPVSKGWAALGECCQLRMGMAVLEATLTWGKTSDSTTIRSLAGTAGLSRNRADKGLSFLKQQAGLVYRPGTTGYLGHLSLRPGSAAKAVNPNFGDRLDRLTNEQESRAFIQGVLRCDYPAADLRVALWVLENLTTWMRADAQFRTRDAAAETGVSASAFSRALKSFHLEGLLQYRAGSGRGQRSSIALPGYPLSAPVAPVDQPGEPHEADRVVLVAPARRKVASRAQERSLQEDTKVGVRATPTGQFLNPVDKLTPGRPCVDEQAEKVLRQVAERLQLLGQRRDAQLLWDGSPARDRLSRALSRHLRGGLTPADLIDQLWDGAQPWPRDGADDPVRLLRHRLNYGSSLPGLHPAPPSRIAAAGPFMATFQSVANALAVHPADRPTGFHP